MRSLIKSTSQNVDLFYFFLLKLIITIGLINIGNQVLYAQKTLILHGLVKDALTKRDIRQGYCPFIEVFNGSDTTLIGKYFYFSFQIEKPKGKYLLRYILHDVDQDNLISEEESDDYEEEWTEFDSDALPESVMEFTLPPVYMRRHYQKKLDEVTVTASRILFYHRGDTLIYNASAFVLAEGSMLDALIKQLPGTSIDSKGVITCNGRKIDNLLLNGKDLFNGNHELMLENLPAYTVKNIQVYDKQGKTSELMGMDAGDSKHVMDVKLKRQYSHGFMSNVEAGYGTHDRYLGRLFGMWFTENASMTVHAGINNLNDRAEPGQNDSWWNRDLTVEGVSENKFGGITYNVNNSANTVEIKGDVKVKHTSAIKDLEVNEVRILPDKESYNYRWSHTKEKIFEVTTGHNLQARLGDRANLEVKPEFQYRKNDQVGSTLNATFNEEVQDLSRARIEAVYSGSDKVLADIIVNRDKYDGLTQGHTITGKMLAGTDIKISETDMLRLWLQGDYRDQVNDRFETRNINYGGEAKPAYTFNRYFKNYPDRDKSIESGVKYYHFIRTWLRDLAVEYAFCHGEERRTSFLYNLHELDVYGGNDMTLGILPSQLEYERTFSSDNSYWSATTINEHKFQIILSSFKFYIKPFKTNVSGSLNIPISIFDRRYHYVGRGIDETLKRTEVCNILYSNDISGTFYISVPKWEIYFRPRYGISSIDFSNLMSVTDATNPLNVSLGNPDLKQQSTLHLYADIRHSANQFRHLVNLQFSRKYNSVARASLYNPKTGGYTSIPCNINGYYGVNGTYELFRPFGSGNRFDISLNTGFVFSHSIDVSGISTNTTPDLLQDIPLSVVNMIKATEGIKFNWTTGGNRFTISDDFDVRNYNSSWSKFTSWTNNLGASFVLNLPHNWGLSSDVSVYTRRGFTDDRLNTTDVVWNARITKSILGGSILFIADAYDLLHQLSNITYTINAQARTETVSNVIPSYMLLRIQYKFNKRPGR